MLASDYYKEHRLSIPANHPCPDTTPASGPAGQSASCICETRRRRPAGLRIRKMHVCSDYWMTTYVSACIGVAARPCPASARASGVVWTGRRRQEAAGFTSIRRGARDPEPRRPLLPPRDGSGPVQIDWNLDKGIEIRMMIAPPGPRCVQCPLVRATCMHVLPVPDQALGNSGNK
jgi:hypothetical protein